MDEQIPGQLDLVTAIEEVMRPLTAAELEYLEAPADDLAESA